MDETNGRLNYNVYDDDDDDDDDNNNNNICSDFSVNCNCFFFFAGPVNIQNIRMQTPTRSTLHVCFCQFYCKKEWTALLPWMQTSSTIQKTSFVGLNFTMERVATLYFFSSMFVYD
jgi:hypothetical protein